MRGVGSGDRRGRPIATRRATASLVLSALGAAEVVRVVPQDALDGVCQVTDHGHEPESVLVAGPDLVLVLEDQVELQLCAGESGQNAGVHLLCEMCRRLVAEHVAHDQLRDEQVMHELVITLECVLFGLDERDDDVVTEQLERLSRLERLLVDRASLGKQVEKTHLCTSRYVVAKKR